MRLITVIMLAIWIILILYYLIKIFKTKNRLKNISKQEIETLKVIKEKLKGVNIFNNILSVILEFIFIFSILLFIHNIILCIIEPDLEISVYSYYVEFLKIFNISSFFAIASFGIYILKNIIIKIYIKINKKLDENQKKLLGKIYRVSIIGLIILFIFINIYRFVWGAIFTVPYT